MSLTTPLTKFAVTLQNCDSEPIDLPGAIQPCGALLAFDRAGLLAYASTNVGDVLGTAGIPGVSATGDAFPDALSQVHVKWLSDEESDFDPFVMAIQDVEYDVIR